MSVRRMLVFGVAIPLLALVAVAMQPGCAADPSQAPTFATAGIALPPGFEATIFADGTGRARQIAVRENGDVFVALRQQKDGAGIVALRDEDGDGKADVIERFGDVNGTGIAFYKDYLYFGTESSVVRFPMAADKLRPTGPMQPVAQLPTQHTHAAKPITFDSQGHLYVNIGAPSNACQQESRTPGSPGLEPCPQLEQHAGIWRFDADITGQTQEEHGHRYATGLRNCVALEWNHVAGSLYAVMHGRDQLNTLFPKYFDAKDNAQLPAEEFHKLEDSSNAGWPYTYWDGRQDKRVIAPEYGGDGEKAADPSKYQEPIQVFPAHWAPNDLLFYTGTQFPAKYRHGAFIAWHGSWNRAPLEQRGYKITFTPMNDDGLPAGDPEVFADGFAGMDPIASPSQAEHRPMGLAVAPDGALFITDSVVGRVWRVSYTGE
ncbi:MAG: PQQ-dependent sugar dehydrogenase [Candidatus Hydrogenedentota bacterium]